MSKLLSLLRRHPELLLFGTIAAIYTICCTPDFTWMNVSCDGFGFYLRAHDMSSAALLSTGSVQNALGWISLHIPLGSEAWRLAFFTSAVPAILTSILIFFAVRKQTSNRLSPYIASAVFSGSALIVAQATIVESYALVTFFIVLAYTLTVYNYSKLAVVAICLAPLVHTMLGLLGIMFIVLVKPSVLRKAWYVGVVAIAPTAWIYMTKGEEHSWSALFPLIGIAPVGSVPGNTATMILILVGALGLGLISAWLFLRNWRRSYPFMIVVAIPTAFFLIQSTHEAYVQSYLAVALLSITAGLGIDYIRWNVFPKLALVVGCAMLLAVPLSWDIGRTLDESPTTARQFLTQIEQMPSNSALLCLRLVDGKYDWHGVLSEAGVEIVGRSDILTIDLDKYYHSEGYRENLQKVGYKTPTLEYCGTHHTHYMRYLVTLGDVFAAANPTKSVYTVEVDRPEVLGCEIIKLE